MFVRLCSLARWLLAGILLIGGANGFLEFLPVAQPLHPWLQIMVESGYLTLPKLLELAAGGLLLTRYRLLGQWLMWPIVINITLFHLLLDPRQLALVPPLLVLAVLASLPDMERWLLLLRPASVDDGRVWHGHCL